MDSSEKRSSIGQKRRGGDNILTSNTIKKRRYRENVRKNSQRYEEQKRKDRGRKRKSREQKKRT